MFSTIFLICALLVIFITCILVVSKSTQKFTKAYEKADEFMKSADKDSKKAARDALLLIHKAHNLAFERNTYGKVSDLYAYYKGKFGEIEGHPPKQL